jgi:hypothetical protein
LLPLTTRWRAWDDEDDDNEEDVKPVVAPVHVPSEVSGDLAGGKVVRDDMAAKEGEQYEILPELTEEEQL